jgi:hypothetical protein
LWLVVTGQFIPDYPKRGDWQVNNDGAYCRKVLWPMGAEDWCGYVFQLGNDHYVGGKRATAPLTKLNIQRK